ncbi:MAG: hypothetical protein AAF471_07280 [Myxococcota bacterium]
MTTLVVVWQKNEKSMRVLSRHAIFPREIVALGCGNAITGVLDK